jgi:hypothetical protein
VFSKIGVLGRRKRRRLAGSLVLAWGLATAFGGVPRAAAQVSDPDAKAVFLDNFAKFIQWPAEAFEDTQAPLVFGVLGADPLGEALVRGVQGRKVNGRRVQVRQGRTLAEIGHCQLLYLTDSEQEHVADLLASLPPGVVTVSDMDEFARLGGMLQIAIIQLRVRFALNTARAEHSGVRISSKVLALSRIVVSRS